MLASLFVSGAICYNQSQNIPSLKFPNYVAECEQKWKTIKREEVAKHKTKETRLWVTYKKGVFDITGWLEGHPGGKPALFQAAGGPIEPFWSTYRLHYEPKFETLLNTFKIGELPDDEVMEFDDSLIPWPRQNIASRTAMTLLTQTYPYNCMTNPILIVRHFITPLREGYVRSHNRVPIINEDEHEINLFNAGKKVRTLKIEDLRELPQHEVMVCMRCAGHRRSEMTDMRPNVIRGVNYGPYAIYNVRYKGPLVIDVLKASGVDLNKVKDKHLWTTGFDEDFPGDPVQTSVVMSHVLDPRNEVILAIEANGEDIPEDHGYPVRILYPGFIGLRSTKWLCKMEIMDNESPCRFQQRAYKLYKEDTWAEVDTTKYPPPMGHVLNCVIAEPLKGDVVKCTVEHPYIEIKGVAVGEGGTGGRVTKVEISQDDGKTWDEATITQREEKDPSAKVFSWVHWTYNMKVVPPTQKLRTLKVTVRAYDSTGHNMHKSVQELFNLSGTMVNPPHSVEFKYNLDRYI